jgi:hypothetical protein
MEIIVCAECENEVLRRTDGTRVQIPPPPFSHFSGDEHDPRRLALSYVWVGLRPLDGEVLDVSEAWWRLLRAALRRAVHDQLPAHPDRPRVRPPMGYRY